MVFAGQIYTASGGACALDTALTRWSAFASRTHPAARARASPAAKLARDAAAFAEGPN